MTTLPELFDDIALDDDSELDSGEVSSFNRKAHELAVKALLGLEYYDFHLTDTPSNFRGIQVQQSEENPADLECDIFYTLAKIELRDGYWPDSVNDADKMDQACLYDVSKTERWYAYTPKTTGHSGCQLEASYAPTAQGRSSWGIKHGDLGKASQAAGLDAKKYHAAVERLKGERAIHGIEEVVKPSKERARRLARELKADNRKLSNIPKKFRALSESAINPADLKKSK